MTGSESSTDGSEDADDQGSGASEPSFEAYSKEELLPKKLGRSDGRFELLVQAVEEYAIFMLDPEGRVQSWNAGAQRIKGYSEEEVLGEPFSVFYTDEDVEVGRPEKGLEQAAREGQWTDEGWRVRKDGSNF